MKDKPENPQAFPDDFSRGMLLRDYFAAKAFDKSHDAIQEIATEKGVRFNASMVAALAYKYANAMLAERSKSDE